MASLQNIHVGDIVKVDKLGRIFYALVEGKERGALSIKSLEGSRVSYTHARSREVIEHWRKTKNVRRTRESTGHSD